MEHENSSSGPGPDRGVKSVKATHELVDYVMAAHKRGGRPSFYVDKDE